MERVNCKKTPLEPLKKRCRALMACPFRRVLSAMHPLYQPGLDKKKNGILGLGIAGPQIGDMVSYYRYSKLEPKLVTQYSSGPSPHELQNLISTQMIKSMFQEEVLVEMKALLADPQSNGYGRQWFLWQREDWHPGKANWMELSMNGDRSDGTFPWIKVHSPQFLPTRQEWALRLMIHHETWLQNRGPFWPGGPLTGPFIPAAHSDMMRRFAYACIAARIAWPWSHLDCGHMLLRGYWVEVSVVYATDTHYDTVLRLAVNPPLLALGDHINLDTLKQGGTPLEWPIRQLAKTLSSRHYIALAKKPSPRRLGSRLGFSLRAEKAWRWYKRNDMQLMSTLGDNIVLWDFIMTVSGDKIANMCKTDFCNNPEAVAQVEALMIQYGEFTAPAKRRRL